MPSEDASCQWNIKAKKHAPSQFREQIHQKTTFVSFPLRWDLFPVQLHDPWNVTGSLMVTRGLSLGKEGENCLPLFHHDYNLMLSKFLRFGWFPPKPSAFSSEPLAMSSCTEKWRPHFHKGYKCLLPSFKERWTPAKALLFWNTGSIAKLISFLFSNDLGIFIYIFKNQSNFVKHMQSKK